MRLVAPLFILLIFACSDTAQNSKADVDPRLSQWKTGDFYYVDKMFGKFEIIRSEEVQVEKILSNGMEVAFKIEWLNDSMYKLYYDGVHKNPHNISLPHDIDSLIKTCTITELTDTSYNEKATSNLNKSVNYTLMQK